MRLKKWKIKTKIRDERKGGKVKEMEGKDKDMRRKKRRKRLKENRERRERKRI